MYAEERADIHDFLVSLSPEQWDTPSLCAGWQVRDVAVHLLVDGVAGFAGPWRPGMVSNRLGPEVGMRATVIHHQDMRRPLGMPRVIPEERLRAALDVILTPRGSTNLGSLQRSEGMALRATDLDWSWGQCPEVSGPAESILMTLAGRPSALADLAGEGIPALAAHVGALD